MEKEEGGKAKETEKENKKKKQALIFLSCKGFSISVVSVLASASLLAPKDYFPVKCRN